MSLSQPGILASETLLARYLTFSIANPEDLPAVMAALVEDTDGSNTVIGIGASLVATTSRQIPGLRSFPAQTGSAVDIPSTPAALWCWLRGTDRGEIYHRSRQLEALLTPCFVVDQVIDSFQFAECRDLSGYIDGTENPKDEDMLAAAIVNGQGAGLDGSSFVAVQQWLHDFDSLDDMTQDRRDNTIGRRLSDNEELEDAPASAHVKRTAQESFDPEAFVLRRSMPWADDMAAGLNFVAFGKSFDAFEALLNRMLGHEDGINDALFDFTRPVTGAYFWCPPVEKDRLDLSALGY
ncbi:MAG: Dyp-type peroxidase [Acidiferrobacterales bacterium]